MSNLQVSPSESAERDATPETNDALIRTNLRGLRPLCLVNRIRRIKCDELKPQCRRCVSTGRVCDGYEAVTTAAAAKSASSAAALLLGPRLLLPRRDTEEIRSYRFFLDVVSPSLAGFFYDDFWMREVPRLSHADPAIWHAVVSLGAAHELFSRAADPSLATSRLTRLVLAQFNQAIQCLVQPSARHGDRSRALTASILFTHISTARGQHAEALMHLDSSRKLLAELSHATIQAPRPQSRFSATTVASPADAAVSGLPVSIDTADGIITYFEIQAASIRRGGLLHSSDILAASEAFNIWRYYQAPPLPAEADLVDMPRSAWDSHFVRANRAAESLVNGMIYHAQQNTHLVQRVKAFNDLEAAALLEVSERPFLATFRELTRLARAYEHVRGQSSPWLKSPPPPLHFLSLLLFLLIIRLLFQQDPDVPDPTLREQIRTRHFTAILDLGEDILRRRDVPSDGGAPEARPLILGPLSMVAHGGTTQALRRRAIALMLAFPERQALSDGVMNARIFEAMLEREQVELRRVRATDWAESDDEGDDEELEVPFLNRSFNSVVRFVGERSAVVGSRTWDEVVRGEEGHECLVHW